MLCSLSQTPALDNCGTRLQDHRFAPLCTHADPAIDRDAAFIHCGSVYLALSISSHRLKSVTKTLRTARSQFIHLVKHWKSKRFLWYCALVGFCIGFAASIRVTAVIWYGILAVFLGSWWVINGVRSRRENTNTSISVLSSAAFLDLRTSTRLTIGHHVVRLVHNGWRSIINSTQHNTIHQCKALPILNNSLCSICQVISTLIHSSLTFMWHRRGRMVLAPPIASSTLKAVKMFRSVSSKPKISERLCRNLLNRRCLSNRLFLTPHMAPRYSSPAWTRAKTLRPHPALNLASCAHDHS